MPYSGITLNDYKTFRNKNLSFSRNNICFQVLKKILFWPRAPRILIQFHCIMMCYNLLIGKTIVTEV